jgi:hypothetical protein
MSICQYDIDFFVKKCYNFSIIIDKNSPLNIIFFKKKRGSTMDRKGYIESLAHPGNMLNVVRENTERNKAGRKKSLITIGWFPWWFPWAIILSAVGYIAIHLLVFFLKIHR